jgi:S1-C subfamily serine protease
MSIAVCCPECSDTFSVRDESAGRRCQCPHCGHLLRAPETSDADPSEPAASGGIPAIATDRTTSDRKTSGRKISDRGKAPRKRTAETGRADDAEYGSRAMPAMPTWGWIAVGILALTGIGLTAAAFALRPTTASAAKADAGNAKASAGETKKALAARRNELRGKLATLRDHLAEVESQIDDFTAEPEIVRDVLPGIVKVLRFVDGQPAGSGTGFLINDDHWVATNHHVIDGAKSLAVLYQRGDQTEQIEVEGVIADKPTQDLAILKPKKKIPGGKVLKIARDGAIAAGATVYALGNPGKHLFTTARGIVTRVTNQRKLMGEQLDFDYPFSFGDEQDVTYVEHDSRIFPGNSGGPLLNERFEVIGVNTLLSMVKMNSRPGVMLQSFGLASHSRYIHKLMKDAPGTVMSLSEAAAKAHTRGGPPDAD